MNNRPSWDDYFLHIATVVATRSPDTTQHGCVLVDRRQRIISTGYNGPIRGSNDDAVPKTRPEKYDWLIHAEDNAVLFAERDLTGATAYITGFPCAACLRRLIQAGVRRIVYGQVWSQCISSEERSACEAMAAQHSVQLEYLGPSVSPFVPFVDLAARDSAVGCAIDKAPGSTAVPAES